MKNKIYLVRHGQDEDNANGILNGHRDKPLTNIGIKQAEQVAKKIQKEKINFDVVISSPLKRASKTTKIICKKLHIKKFKKDDLLIEREFGIITGQKISSVVDMCRPNILQTEHINYFLNPNGSETFPDLKKRARKLLNKIDNNYSKSNILLVAHGDIGKMLYAEYYHCDWKKILESFHFGNSEMLILSEDSPVEEVYLFRIKQHNKAK